MKIVKIVLLWIINMKIEMIFFDSSNIGYRSLLIFILNKSTGF